jgi:hypothetical protein
VSELEDAAHNFAWLYLNTMDRPNRLMMSRTYNETARELARIHGGRRKLLTHVTELQDNLWQLLAEPDWRDPDPTMLWEDATLADDWESSPHSQVRRRWSLVAAAVGNSHLVLTSQATGDPHVRVVPSGQ